MTEPTARRDAACTCGHSKAWHEYDAGTCFGVTLWLNDKDEYDQRICSCGEFKAR